MSAERELLKTILAYMAAEYLVMTEFEMITQIEDTIKEIQELLAQPEQEQEPVAWGYKKRVTYKPEGSEEEEIIPLYTAPPPPTPPNRKPINTERITLEMFSEGIDINYKDGYVAGIKFAEKAHGITGVDDE